MPNRAGSWEMTINPEDFPFMQEKIYDYSDFIRTQTNVFFPVCDKCYLQAIDDEILDDYNSFAMNSFHGYMLAIELENERLVKLLQTNAKDLKSLLGDAKEISKEVANMEKKVEKDPSLAQELSMSEHKKEQVEQLIQNVLLNTEDLIEKMKELSVKFYRSFNPQLMGARYEFVMPTKKNGRGEVENFKGVIGQIGQQKQVPQAGEQYYNYQ